MCRGVPGFHSPLSQNTLPGHMLPTPTPQQSRDWRAQETRAQDESVNRWARHSLKAWRPQPSSHPAQAPVCLLTPFHWVLDCSQFTVTFRLPPQSWAELLHQGPSCCSNPVLSTSGRNCSPDAHVRHKLARQPLPTERLWPASLLSVDTEPLGCRGKNCSHPSPAHQFYISSPHVHLWVTLKAFQQDWSCL